jgi:hypothetical protein
MQTLDCRENARQWLKSAILMNTKKDIPACSGIPEKMTILKLGQQVNAGRDGMCE